MAAVALKRREESKEEKENAWRLPVCEKKSFREERKILDERDTLCSEEEDEEKQTAKEADRTQRNQRTMMCGRFRLGGLP